MELSGKDYSNLFDFNECDCSNMITQNLSDYSMFSNDSYPATPQVTPNGGIETPTYEVQKTFCSDRYTLYIEKRKQRNQLLTAQAQQDYQRIMNSFVKILPKPAFDSFKNGLKTELSGSLKTHGNGWSCILCKKWFTDFNQFKLHHNTDKQPSCTANKKPQ